MIVSEQLHAQPALSPKTKWLHGIGGWVGPQASMYGLKYWKIPSPCQISNHDSSVTQPTA